MMIPNSHCDPCEGKPLLKPDRTQLELNHGNHLRLRAEQDLRLSAIRGVAWITVEMEAGEAMVRPGVSFTIASGKTALVGPLHESVTLELGIASNASERVAKRPMPWNLGRLLRRTHGHG